MDMTWYLISMVVTATLVSLVLIFALWLKRRIWSWYILREYYRVDAEIKRTMNQNVDNHAEILAAHDEIIAKIKKLAKPTSPTPPPPSEDA